MKTKATAPPMQYPAVLTEEETLKRVLAGTSIGRFGDGELNIMRGGDCVSQKYDSNLSDELRHIAAGYGQSRNSEFLIGVPTLDSRSPKISNWMKLAPRFAPYLTAVSAKGTPYGSAFISRPDSAPWIDTAGFFDGVQSLWEGQEVVLVANGVRSLTEVFLEETGARRVLWVTCSYRDSYAQVDGLVDTCVNLAPRRVIICAGPTGTVLADRLARAGKHAIDLGHIGMFWRRYLDPTNPVAKHIEQREINKQTGQVEPNP